MHQFIGQNFTKPCCNYTVHSSLTPKKYWDSQELVDLKKQLESGIWPRGCGMCKHAEENNIISLRERSLNEYDIPATPSVEYLDIRLSNKCNFACRTCEPMFSSRIAKEVQTHDLHKFFNYQLDKNYVEHSDQISIDVQQHLHTVKKIMFTGGEPTYIKQFYEILDQLIVLGREDQVHLCVTTNASMIDDKFLSYARKFAKLHITVSLDAVGEPAEYIRYGTVWKTVDANIQKILNLKCSVMINSVISAYSIVHLESLVDYIIVHEQDEYSADMCICTTPMHLNPCVLPKNSRNKLINITERCISKLSASPRFEDYRDSLLVLDGLKQQLTNVFLSSDKFLEYTNTLDSIRKQKYDDTYFRM